MRVQQRRVIHGGSASTLHFLPSGGRMRQVQPVRILGKLQYMPVRGAHAPAAAPTTVTPPVKTGGRSVAAAESILRTLAPPKGRVRRGGTISKY